MDPGLIVVCVDDLELQPAAAQTVLGVAVVDDETLCLNKSPVLEGESSDWPGLPVPR